MMKKTEKKVEEFIRKYHMIEEGDRVIAGVSGGADSVCLLFMLCSLRGRLGFEVSVCHVNHGLRGADADADERYVEALCGKLKVPCRIFRENVELTARKRKQSLEEAGRMVRREAFETMCREDGGTKIATAHHRDDNAETMIMNLARGTGLKGLCGIRPVRDRWIRPLLCLGRDEIEEWTADHQIDYCRDATNDEDEYTRNRIRHHIIPALEQQVNAGAARHLAELSAQLSEVWDFMQDETEKARKECVLTAEEPDGRRVVKIDGAGFARTAPAVRKFLAAECIREAAEADRDIEAVHIAALTELFGKQTGKTLDLPYRVKALRTYEGVSLFKKTEMQAGASETERKLEIPGETFFPETGQKICCTVADSGGDSVKEIPQKSYTKCFDYDIIKYSLSARFRRPGDYLTVDGTGSRQKLKSYFINEKVPREERDRKLLIADGDHIVWIPGMRMSSAYQVGNRTKRILKIKITEEQ